MSKNLFREQFAWKHSLVSEMDTPLRFDQHDIDVLRTLATEMAALVHTPENEQKKDLWYQHNDMASTDAAPIYVDLEGGWNEVNTDEVMQCRDPLARTWENWLRKRLFLATQIKDDTVMTDTFDVPWVYTEGSWGFEVIKTGGTDGGSFHLTSSFDDYDKLDQLHFPDITIDWEKTERVMELAHQVFDGILTVRRYMNWHWAVDYIDKFVLIRGYEEFLCDCACEQEGLEQVLDLISKGMNARLDWMEREHLLRPNSGGEVIGTGGLGYTKELAQAEMGGNVTTRDLWGCVQGQETLTISPDTFGEIFLPHLQKIANRYGRVYYGCCERYDTKWQYIKQIPNLKKVSVSPWADYTTVPDYLGKDYLAAIKLHPLQMCIPNMDEDVVRQQCRHAVEVTKGCYCEFILKNTTTLAGKPQNAVRWAQIMREEIDRIR